MGSSVLQQFSLSLRPEPHSYICIPTLTKEGWEAIDTKALVSRQKCEGAKNNSNCSYKPPWLVIA